jgi:coenzyme A diphosphatase NUDT7
MRSFPGETALPGGRMEDSDINIESTALREALEETALSPSETNEIHILKTIYPFLSKNLLFVIPVVAYTRTLVEDLLPTLKPNAEEVGSIWTWPLKDLLGVSSRDSIDGLANKRDKSTEKANGNKRIVKYSYRDVNWLSGKSFRLHEFQHEDMGSAVTGLTAEILLEVALIAYDVKKPLYARGAPGQMSAAEMVRAVIEGKAGLDGDERSSLRKGRVTEDTIAALE